MKFLRFRAAAFVSVACAGSVVAQATNEMDTSGRYNSCGLNSLFMVSKLMDKEIGFKELAGLLKPDATGSCSIADLERAALDLGLKPVALETGGGRLSTLPLPAIAHLRSKRPKSTSNHYVVVMACLAQGVVTVDPPYPATVHSYKEFLADWTGVIVCFPRSNDELQQCLAGTESRNDWIYLGITLVCFGLAIVCARFVGDRKGSKAVTQAMILIFLGLAAGCHQEDQSDASLVMEHGSLVIENSNVDFGYVEPGNLPFSITLSNRGESEVTIQNVISTCSCTRAAAESPIAPKSTGLLSGVIEVIPGPGSADVSLTSSDSVKRHRIRLQWYGKTKPTIIPTEGDLSVMDGRVASREIEVSYPSAGLQDYFKLMAVEGLPPEAKVVELGDDPVRIHAEPGLSTTSKSSPSPFVGSARLRLDITGLPKSQPTPYHLILRGETRSGACELNFALRVTPHVGIRAIPSDVFISLPRSGEADRSSRQVRLVLDKEGDVTVHGKSPFLDAVVGNPGATGDAAGSKATRLLTIQMKGTPPAGTTEGEVRVRDGEGQTLTIPVILLDR